MACEDMGSPAMYRLEGSQYVPAISSSSKHTTAIRSPIHSLIGDAFNFRRVLCLL